MNKITFLFLRLPIAVSLFGHGAVRLPKLKAFSDWMVGTMEQSVLPDSLVMLWSYFLPFAELILGVLLLIGFKPKLTIYASLVLMSLLILGSSLIENWGAIETQLIHAAYLFGLLWYLEKNDLTTEIIRN